MTHLLGRILQSPANWYGLTAALLAVFVAMMGFVALPGWLVAPLVLVCYLLGFGLGGLVSGFPGLDPGAGGGSLDTGQGAARVRISGAVVGVRDQIEPGGPRPLPKALRQKTQALLNELGELVGQWGAPGASLSMEDAFDAERIATRYLPEALRGFHAIPREFARTRLLDNGRTAADTLDSSLDELRGKVGRLREALMQDQARGLVSQAEFLQHKFGSGRGRGAEADGD